MQTTLIELPDSRARVEVEVPAEDVARATSRAARALARAMRLPGFRKGKAPRGLVMQRIGRDAVVEEALEHHLSGWYRRAVAVSRTWPAACPVMVPARSRIARARATIRSAPGASR